MLLPSPSPRTRSVQRGLLCVPCVFMSPSYHRTEACGPACLLRAAQTSSSHSVHGPHSSTPVGGQVSVPITHRARSGFRSGRPSAGEGHRSQPAARGGTQGPSTGTCGSGKSQSQISAWSVGDERHEWAGVSTAWVQKLCPRDTAQSVPASQVGSWAEWQVCQSYSPQGHES